MGRHFKTLGTLPIPHCFCNNRANKQQSLQQLPGISSLTTHREAEIHLEVVKGSNGLLGPHSAQPREQGFYYLPPARGLFCSSSPSVSCSKASAALLLLDPSQQGKCQKGKQKPQAAQTFVGAVI